jgi:hypothetical protein
MKMLKDNPALLMSVALSLMSLLQLSAAADDQVSRIENVPGMPSYIVSCNGVPMHTYDIAASPCATNAPQAKPASAANLSPRDPTVDDPSLNGPWVLEMVNGGIWVTPSLEYGTFDARRWTVDMVYGQKYPADPAQGIPETTMFFGRVIDACGSYSFLTLNVPTQTPDIGTLYVRLNDCAFSPVNGINRVYIEAVIKTLYTRDRVTMGGVITSSQFDNRLSPNGPPNRVMDFAGVANFGRSLAVVGKPTP